MRNFSELFGTELGRRAGHIAERQDLLGTTRCSFLDFRNEIESARKSPGRSATRCGCGFFMVFHG